MSRSSNTNRDVGQGDRYVVTLREDPSIVATNAAKGTLGIFIPFGNGSADPIVYYKCDAGKTTNWKPFLSSASSVASEVCNDYTANGAITDRAICQQNGGSNLASMADASSVSTADAIGFAKGGVLNGQVVSICSEGVLDGFSGLTPNARYFLSETPGAITTTPPSTDEAVIVQVGYAKSTTQMQIHIEQIAEIDTD